jgi:tRNA:m4X modification enzyme
MGDIEEVVLEHPVMNSDLSDPANGATALKHIRQQASILGHLERLQLIRPNTCFIEFGAGRGKLSNCLQRVCVNDDTIHYLLVDRDSCRRKKDVYLRGDPSNEARVQRLNIDIEHLDLGRVEVVQGSEVKQVVAVSKHLCGSATDLTLRCLLETLPHDDHQPINPDDVTLHHRDGPANPKRVCTRNPTSKLSGIVIALCCHHRCSWGQLAGTHWLGGRGFSPIDAHLVSKMTSWAVCGVRSPDRDSEHDMEHEHSFAETGATTTTDSTHHVVTMTTDPTHSNITTKMNSTPHPPSYHPHPREEVGLKCKRVLDLARLHYLRERGMEGRLLYFVSRSTSLENVLLIATPKKHLRPTKD